MINDDVPIKVNRVLLKEEVCQDSTFYGLFFMRIKRYLKSLFYKKSMKEAFEIEMKVEDYKYMCERLEEIGDTKRLFLEIKDIEDLNR